MAEASLAAFAAGVLSFFAPCAVAMLPAYISYYLRGEAGAADAPVRRGPAWAAALLLVTGLALLALALADYELVTSGRAALSALPVALLLAGLAAAGLGAWLRLGSGFARPLQLGGLTALGILAVFALLGLPLGVVLGVLDFPRLALFVLLTAAVLVALGVLGLAGRDVSVVLPVRAPRRRTPLAFFLFGVAYGLVSMGCTLPLFLAGVLGPYLRSGHALDAALGAASYGAGMGSVMLVTTFSLAMSRGLTRPRLRAAVPWVKRVSNVVLILAGLYIIAYVLSTPGFRLP
jgi:cytochrome c biogenesis protein CcdA